MMHVFLSLPHPKHVCIKAAQNITMCHDLDPNSDECQGLFTCTLFKYILYLICKCMSGLHSLNALILKSWREVGGGLLTLTHNNLLYLGALIGVAPSIVNTKKLMLSPFTKTFILFFKMSKIWYSIMHLWQHLTCSSYKYEICWITSGKF